MSKKAQETPPEPPKENEAETPPESKKPKADPLFPKETPKALPKGSDTSDLAEQLEALNLRLDSLEPKVDKIATDFDKFLNPPSPPAPPKKEKIFDDLFGEA